MKIDEPPTPYNRDYDSADEADDEYGSNSESEEMASDKRKRAAASTTTTTTSTQPTTDTSTASSTTAPTTTVPSSSSVHFASPAPPPATTSTTTTTTSATSTGDATQPPRHHPPVSPRTLPNLNATEHSAALRSALKRTQDEGDVRPRPRFFSSSEDETNDGEPDGHPPQETAAFKQKRSQHYNEWQKLQEFRKKHSPLASGSSTPGVGDADDEEEEEEEEKPQNK
eukprot:TRINITY_DN6359_c0_g1_i1.p1 TRINITY_DN6359_c0_g1~~TRINITY_DN6359_c0_g1_i1.p1  ORF type:complete len:226 (-),score=82.58 TRINITY_DN6359_c0_g1_i1:161-838(-)